MRLLSRLHATELDDSVATCNDACMTNNENTDTLTDDTVRLEASRLVRARSDVQAAMRKLAARAQHGDERATRMHSVLADDVAGMNERLATLAETHSDLVSEVQAEHFGF